MVNKHLQTGYVMVNRHTGFISVFTFRSTRANCIDVLREVYHNASWAELRKEWRPTRAVQTTELADWS